MNKVLTEGEISPWDPAPTSDVSSQDTGTVLYFSWDCFCHTVNAQYRVPTAHSVSVPGTVPSSSYRIQCI